MESLARQLWSSPYVTRKASEWPDEQFMKYWMGPFDMSYRTYAKKTLKAERKEDKGICNYRKLAESLYNVGDFVGARYALAQIADQYISEYQHLSRWAPDVDYKRAWDKEGALRHIVKVSVGCILNTYLAQYPDLCAAIKVNNKNSSSSHIKPHPVFTAAVDYDNDLTNSRALYILRVMLDFASEIEYGKDHSWMCKVYKRAFKSMGQIMDLDLCESIRLRQGLVYEIIESEREAYWQDIETDPPVSWSSWSEKQREAYKIQSTQTWKSEVEELYQHIIADQQRLWGTMAEATICSELELVKHYKSVGDIEKAKANARQLNILTKKNLGGDHDSTLRCMASLSTLLLDIGCVEEAGLVVHDYLTNHSRILIDSTGMLTLELKEKFTKRRGWKEMVVLRGKLEKLMTPFHFIWADHRLYTLRIGTVTLAPSYPADMEKDSVWTLACQEPKHTEDGMKNCSDNENFKSLRESRRQLPSSMRPDSEKYAFSGSERDYEFLDLQVPYIPYQHFVTTPAFKTGMPYLEYTKAAGNWSISCAIHEESATDTPLRLGEFFKGSESCDKNFDTGIEDVEKTEKEEHRKCSQIFDRTDSKECIVIEFDKDPTTTQIQGFFNNIPSEAFISCELNVDLASMQWADYQHFALHKLPDNATEIEIVKGLSLPCRGYISGTWTDFKVCYQQKVHEVFVVDASFLPTGVNAGISMFALRQETMQNSRYREVTNAEKRAFCARLNPSFYCYKQVPIRRPQSVYKRQMAKGTVLANNDEITLWDEMNAREKWDRDFEKRKPTNDADRAILACDLEAEGRRRNVWNEEHVKKSEGEKKSLPVLSMVVSGSSDEKSGKSPSMPSGSRFEEESKLNKNADDESLVGKLKRLRVRRTKVETQKT